MALAMKGAKTISATSEMVWAALHDPDCLKLCVPGCQDLRRGRNRSFRLRVLVQLGLFRLEFRGSVAVTRSDYPRSYVMTGRGDGGFAGHAVGTARVRLVEVPGGCRLTYSVESVQSGPLAGLGALFLPGIAKTLTERFISTLADVVCIAPPGPAYSQSANVAVLAS